MYPASFRAEEDDMVYTQERLKRALDVFRASEPYRKRRGLPGSNLGRLLESRSKQYETRSRNSSLAVRSRITGIWNDKDESGDYSPRKRKEGTKTQKTSQNDTKRKRCDTSGRDTNRASKRSRVSYISGRQNGLSLEVTFRFKSDAAKAKLAELFPPIIPAAEVNQEGQEVRDFESNGHGEKTQDTSDLLPTSKTPSFLCGRPVAQYLEENDTEVEYVGSVETVNQNEPIPHRFSTASQSDPIVIDDSDDSRTDYGDLLDNSDLHTLGSQTRMLTTSWVHPIDYRCKPEVCNFCQDFRYSLFGCGSVNIEVIELDPGIYEEMGGGHREKGMEPTKICLNCSLERIAIAKCPRHEVLGIEGYVEDGFDHQSFLSQIASSIPPEHPTCSICIKPAFYACGARQAEDPFGLPIAEEDASGCGLLLCGDCAGLIMDCGLDMERLRGFAGSTKILRADLDFLLRGSDLWLAWRK